MTDTLSPRLIDRAWVILLQNGKDASTLNFAPDTEEPAENLTWNALTWDCLQRYFGIGCQIAQADTVAKDETLQKIYTQLQENLLLENIRISRRSHKAIRAYLEVAYHWFTPENSQRSAAVIALDFAVAQRVLPQLSGHGTNFATMLERLQETCTTNQLTTSAEIIQTILETGRKKMNYYRFFQ